MKEPDKYNDVEKDALQFCVQGTNQGRIDTRWQTVEELKESCSREAFVEVAADYIKELQKSFKREAKRFKAAADLEQE